MGREHLESFAMHPSVEVSAIADTNVKHLEEVGDAFGIVSRYADAEQMLADEHLDLVSIVTPNRFHRALTLAAFDAGCHVLCEKPMAMNLAEAREMAAAAKAANRRLMINFYYRFVPEALALKAEVDTGILGEVYFARSIWLRRNGLPGFGGWFGDKALSGGGPMIDLGVHSLDFALWLMGYPEARWVLARKHDCLARPLADAEAKTFDVEDFAAALITFENGAALEVEASWASHIAERELMETRLLGTDAGLVHRNVGGDYVFEAEIYRRRDGKELGLTPTPIVDPEPSAMHHLVDCILEGRPHMATGEEGLVVTQLLDAIYESAERGEPVRLEQHCD